MLFVKKKDRLCQKYEAWMLNFSFNFPFSFSFDLFFYCGLRVRVKVTSQSYYHSSVTLYNIVTVTVTSHKVTKKNIEDSGRTILYNIY